MTVASQTGCPAGTSGSVQVCHQLRTSVCSTSPPLLLTSTPPPLLRFSSSPAPTALCSSAPPSQRATLQKSMRETEPCAAAINQQQPPVHRLRSAAVPPTSSTSTSSTSTSCERPGGSAPRRLLQRCGAEAAPRCTEHAELLLLLVPCCTGSHRAEPGCVHPSIQRDRKRRRRGGTNKQTNKQEQTELMQLL